MNYSLLVELSNGEKIKIYIEKPELIYGATAIVSSSVDSDIIGINPVTKENLRVINLKEEENRFFIPSHIQKDYDYAKKQGLELRQVVAPYFYGKGDEEPRDDKETQERHSVVAVIKHDKEDTYLCEDAKGRNCKSFVMGGIEQGETVEEAALREVYEETGYKNVIIDSVCNFKVVNHFYAGYKGVNRYAYLNIVYGKLLDDEKDKIIDLEQAKHDVIWVKRDNLKDFINIDLNKYALDILLNKESAYELDGIMITNDYNNGKKNIEVRKDIINKYCIQNNLLTKKL